MSISSDGNTVVATAPDASAPEPTGFAAAVTRQGVTWGQPVTLVTGHEVTSAAVSADGATIIVGYDGTTAHVFERSSSAWTDSATLSVGSGDTGLGAAVALDATGQEAIVTATDYANPVGTAYVFDHGASGWTQSATITPGDLTGSVSSYGSVAALSSDGATALVAAHDWNGGAGAVYIWTRGASGWAQSTKLTEPSTSRSVNYGYADALSGDGATALVVGDERRRGGRRTCRRGGAVPGSGRRWRRRSACAHRAPAEVLFTPPPATPTPSPHHRCSADGHVDTGAGGGNRGCACELPGRPQPAAGGSRGVPHRRRRGARPPPQAVETPPGTLMGVVAVTMGLVAAPATRRGRGEGPRERPPPPSVPLGYGRL